MPGIINCGLFPPLRKTTAMRIEALTFFRFLAAVAVVFFHFGRELKVPEVMKPLLNLGPEMVTFFFALSGFVLMVSSSRKKSFSTRRYLQARFARIYPVYLVALFVATALSYGKIYNWGYGVNNLKAFFLNLTLTQSWVPPYPLSLNDPAWSLSVEAFFYLSFPLLFFAIRSSEISGRRLAAWALCLYVITQLILSHYMSPQFYKGFPSASHDLLYYFPLVHFCSFVLGVTGGHIFIQNSEKFQQKGGLPFAVFLTALLLTFASLQFQPQIDRWSSIPLVFDASFYSLIFIVFIMAVAYSDNFLTRAFSWAPFVVLGNSSYALYILQKPFNLVFHKLLLPYSGDTPSQQFSVYLILLILISVATYYLIEKPAKKLAMKLFSR
ncbi:MAG: acyltransferase [bacterium]|nr:acyltransferase [bacterium]